MRNNIKQFIVLSVIGIFGWSAFAFAATNTTFLKNVRPEADQTYDLGTTTPAAQWKNIYTKNITVSGTCTGCSSASSNAVSTSTAETANRVPFWTTTSASPALLSGGIAGFTFTNSNLLSVPYASTTAISLSSLTSGRVPYSSTGGLLVDSSNLTYDGTLLNVGANVSLSGTGTSTISKLSVNNLEVGVTGYSYVDLKAPTFTATSTMATSTWANGLEITGGCFKKQGACLTDISSSLTGILEEAGGVVNTVTIGTGLDYTGTTLSLITPVTIANGGTNATSFGTTNGITYYDGTRLVNDADLTFTTGNLLTATYASTTALTISGTGGLYVGTLTGYLKGTSGAVTAQAVPIPVADGGTGATTLTGCLTGNGTGAITGSGTCNTSAASVTSIATTYPVTGGTITTSGTIALDFGTTTTNTWANLQTFSSGINVGGTTFTSLIPTTRALTIAGTANQITSSAGAQDLSADRTWTLSLPSLVVFPGNASSTQLTVTGNTYLATASGNVGIGTTSPSKTLAVQGNSYVSGTSFFGGTLTATSTVDFTAATTKQQGIDKSTPPIASSTLSYFGSYGAAGTTTLFSTWNPSRPVIITDIYCKSDTGNNIFTLSNGTATTTPIFCNSVGQSLTGQTLTVAARGNLYTTFGTASSTVPNGTSLTITYKNND